VSFSRIARGIFAHIPNSTKKQGKKCRKRPQKPHFKEKQADGIICAKRKSNRVDTAIKNMTVQAHWHNKQTLYEKY
jgi:hypothetical protein